MSSNTARAVTDVWIDGKPAGRGELHIEQPWEYARDEHATKPDPTWSHTDTRGHYHAWSGVGKLPTLRRNSVESPGHRDRPDPASWTRLDALA